MTPAADSSFPESMQHALFLESAEESAVEESVVESDKVEDVPSETGECQSSMPLDLSLKEFPLLKCKGKSPVMMENGKSSESAEKSEQVQHSSPILTNMEFETYKNTLVQAGSTSRGQNKQVIASVSHPQDPQQRLTVIGRQEQNELSEGQGKKYGYLTGL